MGGKTSKTDKKISKAELTEEEIKFLQNNTHFNREQILEWHSGFIKDCPKGKLDKKKFVDVYKQFYPHGKAEKFCGTKSYN